jgi:glycerophosphoryl diester phosphodiesterase
MPTFASNHIKVHGHRGARARFPENTLPAFEYALKIGVDVLEMDMNVTKDNVIVIAHDSFIDPIICLGPDGKPLEKGPLIRDLTLKEIKGFDCGTLKNPDFPNQTPVPHTQIPTLEEVFDLVKHSPFPTAKTVRFNIETKITEENPEYTVDPKTFVELFLSFVDKHQMRDRVILQSFDYRTLAELEKMAPSIPRSALTNKKFGNSADIIRDTRAQYISPHWIFVNPYYSWKMHSLNALVAPWTANKPSQWNFLIRSNVDAIISDDPEALIAYLKEKGLR